jgi:hypothetical protein
MNLPARERQDQASSLNNRLMMAEMEARLQIPHSQAEESAMVLAARSAVGIETNFETFHNPCAIQLVSLCHAK